MATVTDYYELLGVSRTATPDEIKRAFRRLARELHPDTGHGDPEAEARFKAVAHAYEVLSDPEKRRRYDTFGPEGVNGGGSADPFSGFAPEVANKPATREMATSVMGQPISMPVMISPTGVQAIRSWRSMPMSELRWLVDRCLSTPC